MSTAAVHLDEEDHGHHHKETFIKINRGKMKFITTIPKKGIL